MRRRRSAPEDTASWIEYLDCRPVIVAIAGPNGAGKTIFFESHLKATGLRFLNADVLARELDKAHRTELPPPPRLTQTA